MVVDEEALARMAAAVAGVLRAGDAVLLEGKLGAGKTTFARALIRAACGAPGLDVPSPSYTLVQSYESPRFTLHHFDLWRLSGPDALFELGWDEAQEGVVIVEWPGRLGHLTPPQALTLGLAPVPGPAGETRREVTRAGWEGRVHAAGLGGILPPMNLMNLPPSTPAMGQR